MMSSGLPVLSFLNTEFKKKNLYLVVILIKLFVICGISMRGGGQKF